MYFSSDNWAGAHPRIADALTRHSSGFAAAYATSDLDKRVEQKFSAIFERDVTVFFVATGTAANSLSLAAVNRPGGVAFCHREAHMFVDECGAPEMFTHGARLVPVDGAGGKLDPDHLKQEIARFPLDFIHGGRPMAVSVTQATEVGAVYSTDELNTISGICRDHGLPLHMDGARFANAVAHLGQSPAELTWKSGVDIMSFGATKNGCWCAEALVVFDPAKAADLTYIHKRSAHLFSKARFVSAQFETYFEDDLWLHMAGHANALAQQLQSGLAASDRARLAWPVQANEVFAILDRSRADALRQAGAQFHDWIAPHGMPEPPSGDEVLVRFVTSFALTSEDVDQFLDLLRAD
ncbi:MAG: low specificity L-threonine aldolase [Alphaproteobacteria bacterium]|nr:low specificity L-threonine aldolase [Alphaproteobacteria bacterium]